MFSVLRGRAAVVAEGLAFAWLGVLAATQARAAMMQLTIQRLNDQTAIISVVPSQDAFDMSADTNGLHGHPFPSGWRTTRLLLELPFDAATNYTPPAPASGSLLGSGEGASLYSWGETGNSPPWTDPPSINLWFNTPELPVAGTLSGSVDVTLAAGSTWGNIGATGSVCCGYYTTSSWSTSFLGPQVGSYTIVGTYSWKSALGGNWSDSTKWTGGVPDADGAAVAIEASTSAAMTITLDAPQKLGALVLGSGTPGMGYTLSGSGGNTVTFSNTGNSAAATISVIDGTHIMNAPVVLASNLVVTSTSSNPWTLGFGTAGSITDSGNLSLTMKASQGTLILSGSDNYTGGTMVDAGTLIITSSNALPARSNLTIGPGGTLVFDPSRAVAAPTSLSAAPETNPVPEPGMLLLLAAGASGLVGYGLRRRRRSIRRNGLLEILC